MEFCLKIFPDYRSPNIVVFSYNEKEAKFTPINTRSFKLEVCDRADKTLSDLINSSLSTHSQAAYYKKHKLHSVIFSGMRYILEEF